MSGDTSPGTGLSAEFREDVDRLMERIEEWKGLYFGFIFGIMAGLFFSVFAVRLGWLG